MNQPAATKSGTLGTFSGVFTPSVLTILGIILFLRLGYVVGQAGLLKALIIIGIANLISVLTSFSLAAISTNMKVKGGGDYYLISRTLGLEFGGAIGIVLFLAQSVSIAFYCIGFGESVNSLLGNPAGTYSTQLIAGSALLFLFVLAWIGADLATKFQYIVMMFLVLALASFYIGGIAKWNGQMLFQNWTADSSDIKFWGLFALFFPAVTGFTQGVSMSGDLKNPGRSLPVGTFSAVFLSILVYFSVAVIFAASASLRDLSVDYSAMKKISWIGGLIDAGVIAATLSSAMASFLGAPRILQSLSSDRIFGFLTFFEKGYGKTNNPRRAVLLSFTIAALTIILGQLDLIAAIVSMFFLISYGLLNYATYYEAATQSPSFRPLFKWYDRRISLLAFIVCMGAILAIDYKTGIAAGAVLFAIIQYLKRMDLPARWSDSRRSHHLRIIRENLLLTSQEVAHPREWRPFILVLSDGKSDMSELLQFSQMIEGNSGIVTAVQMVQGTGYKSIKQKETVKKALTALITDKRSSAFPLVILTEDIAVSLPVLFQSYGIGPMHANTLLINWNQLQKKGSANSFQGNRRYLFRSALRNGCNIVTLCQNNTRFNNQTDDKKKDEKTIDVWWRDDNTSQLMILLAYLIKRHPEWEEAKIRLLAFEAADDSKHDLETLGTMLKDIRIEAEPQIVKGIDANTIIKISGASDLVFLPVFIKDNSFHVIPTTKAAAVVSRLRTSALVVAAQKMDLTAEPEEGKPAELANLIDELKHAEKRVAHAEKMASETTKAASDIMQSVNIEESLANSKVLEGLKKAIDAREEARTARRKAMIERSKLTEITKKAKEEGVQSKAD